MAYKMKSVIDDVWRTAEDLIGLAEGLEESGHDESADRLRSIVGRIENWVSEEVQEERLPHGYAEIEYDDFESAEAIEGAKWDDLNFMHYMER